jgi:hypothetical protein
MPSPLERPLALWRRSPTGVKGGAIALAALLLAWGLALAAANRPAVLQRLRGTIRETISRRLPGAEIGDAVSIDPLFRVTFGPLLLRAERKGAPPLLVAERVKVRARWLSLLAGRTEPASVRLYGAKLAPGERLAELRALLERMRSRPEGPRSAAPTPRSAPRDWPAIHLRGLTVALRHDGKTIDVGPLDVAVSRDRDGDSDELSLSVSHRSGGRLEASLQRDAAGWRLRAGLMDLDPEALPSELSEGSVRWSGGTVTGELSVAGKTGETATGKLHGRLDRGEFSGERLAPEPVGPITFDVASDFELDPYERRFSMKGARLELLGAVDASLDASARLGPGFPFAVALRVPAIDYSALVDALPEPLRPPPEAPRPSGPLAFRFSLSGPLREPSAWAVEAELDLTALREAARRAPPVALRAPFSWTPEVERGDPPTLQVGPESASFVPLGDLPEHAVRAVTTSEDAGFFAHPGFDFEELKNAFAQGAEAGHVVRGASTITQQLAKNLYLSREKTLVRKAREALVAIALEATVPKARLLEIYLNIAEWGPGLWGIGPAAQHYFGKPARELTVREAAFLASIIPNPVRFHGYYERGELDEAWTERLRVILLHMAEAGVLTEAQLVEALDAPLAFARRTADAGSGALPLPEPALEPLPADGEQPGGDQHQDDADHRSVE